MRCELPGHVVYSGGVCLTCDALVGVTHPMGSPPAPFDPVHKPKHYNSHPSGIECIDITRHMGFNLGNAFKYIWRADLKANALEDLEKAVWYLNDEIKKRKRDAAKT